MNSKLEYLNSKLVLERKRLFSSVSLWGMTHEETIKQAYAVEHVSKQIAFLRKNLRQS